MGEPDRSDTQFVKYPKQIQIRTDRLDTFHRNEQRDFSVRPRSRNFLEALANNEASRPLRFHIKRCNLAETNAQTVFRQVTILDVERRGNDVDVACLEFWQKLA